MALWTHIAEHGAAQPEKIAFVGVNGQHSYADLLADVERSACEIRDLSRPGDVVAVRGQRGYGTLIGLLACLATNRVYSPLDERWPTQRVDLVLTASEASLLIDVDHLDTRTNHLLATMDRHPRPSLAYIIFTSGSTGVPKGVMIENSVLEDRLRSLLPLLTDISDVRFVLNTSISFDISIVELLVPLMAGGTIICPPPLTSNPDAFGEFLNRELPTHLQGTPSFYKLLDAFDQKLPASIEAWCGGEHLDTRLAARLIDRFAVVRNFYGPTEATIWSTFHTLTRDNLRSVGHPFGGTIVHAPGGTEHELAEIVLAGRGLAAGYLRPSDNDGRFVDLPGYGRAYRTGDLGYVHCDGTVHVRGRIDDQVKVNGYRLELADIDAALESHEHVQHAAAFTTIDDDGTVHVNAVYVADNTVPLRELRDHLRTVLPSYALPRRLRRIEQLPLTTAGKVDRKLLGSEPERTATR